jgi:predicted PolB exonuclease-like 3'-5' exonuclease
MQTIIDIETAGLPIEQIDHLAPTFTAPSNYKDADKIAASIAEQRMEWFKRAALSPLTGKIVAIGYKVPNGQQVLHVANEIELLEEFWNDYEKHAEKQGQMIGHNILGFDIPFIIRRSWANKIRVPATVQNGRYLNERRFIDTMTAFQCGNRTEKFHSLDTVAKFMGFAGKTEAIGAQFAEILATDPKRALAYLAADLQAVENIAARMGLLS